MSKKNKISSKKYYYQIIPLVRLSLTTNNEFTYYANELIKFGSVVKIKFNNKIIRGIVVTPSLKSSLIQTKKSTTTKSPFKILPILEIITSAQITKKQLNLAKSISQYYLTPLSTTLKFFTFRLTKKPNLDYFKNLQKQITQINESKWQKKITLTSQQKKIANKIIKQKNNTDSAITTLLFGPPASGKTEVIMEIIKKISQNNKQVLILIPEIFLSYQEIIRYSSKFIDNNQTIAILHSQLKSSEITTIWKGVQQGEIKIIISTRMGIFLPFKNLELIILDEEQDLSHKQWDTPPFYHTRQVIQFMQQIYSSKKFTKNSYTPKSNKLPTKEFSTKIIFSSSTPSLTTYQQCQQKKNWQFLKLAPLKTKTILVKPPQIEMVDLKKYYKKKQQIFISDELHLALKNILKQNKIAFILVPRRGKSSLIICQDCHQTPVCPDCQIPLVHSENYYRCFHCNFKISNISKCPYCGSFRLTDFGFGTESVQNLLQTIFPSAKTALADSNTFSKNNNRQKILKKLYNNKIDFLIGTYTIAKGLDIDNVNLVAILNADNWAGQTDFRFDENYLSTLFQLAGRVNRPGSSQKGKCLIQTYNPTNRLFLYLKNWHWEDFIKYELNNRKILNYPPFSHLIKITFQHPHKKTVQKKTTEFYETLKKYPQSKIIYNILPPYYGHQTIVQKKYQKHILLKINSLPITDKKFIKLLDLPTGWKIDVDTEKIF